MKSIAAFTLGILITACFFVCMGFSASGENSNVRQYKIVEALNRVDVLESKVQSEINSGWSPIGGLTVSELTRGDGKVVYLHQAMVK